MDVIFYRTREGKCPVEVYLESLTSKQVEKVLLTLRVVKTLQPVPAQYLQKLTNTDDLWEVRVIFSGNIFRLLGFNDPQGNLVLAHGFTKKTQKTPTKEIEIAETRKAEYEDR